jgi:hypothetical protein
MLKYRRKGLSFGGLSHFRKGVALMTSYVTYSDLFALALFVVSVIALLLSKRG